GLTKRSAVGFLLRSLIMFQTFISRHNSNFFSDKLVLTSVTPASSAPVLQTPKATSSTLSFDSLTVTAGTGGFLHCIQMHTSVHAANQLVSVGSDRSEERRVGIGCDHPPLAHLRMRDDYTNSVVAST